MKPGIRLLKLFTSLINRGTRCLLLCAPFVALFLKLCKCQKRTLRDACSAVSDKCSPLYDDVLQVLSLPPPPDEGGGESDQEDNSSSVSSASHSDIQKVTCILMEFIEKLTVATTPHKLSPSVLPLSAFPTFLLPPPRCRRLDAPLPFPRVLVLLLVMNISCHLLILSLLLPLIIHPLVFLSSQSLDERSLLTPNSLKEDLR